MILNYFDEQKAKDVVQKYGLNIQIISVWRSRGKIPDRYFFEGFQMKGEKVIGEKDAQTLRDIERIFGYGKININAICRLLGLKKTRVMDILFNDIIATKNELLRIKKAIIMLRIEAQETLTLLNKNELSEITQNKIRNFFSRTEIKTYCLFENKQTAKRLQDWLERKRKTFLYEKVNDIKDALMVFITETTMM